MDLSIIIPSFNTRDLLDRCLSSVYRSLADSPLTAEVIVVDNGSEDGSKELLNNKYTHAIKVFNKENVGYGKANNIGIRMAKGRYILLLNSDCVVLDQALDRLVDFLKSTPKSFVGGKLLNEDMTPQASCGPFYTIPTVLTMLFLGGDRRQVTRYSPEVKKEVDWVSGACILASKVSFLSVGLFDEAIFMYMEEIDLLYRAKQKGYTVYFTPEAQFIHTGAASSKHKKEPVVNIYRGLTYFYKKHRSWVEQGILKSALVIKALVVIFVTTFMRQTDIRKLYEKALTAI